MKSFLLAALLFVFMKGLSQIFIKKIGHGIGGKFEKSFPGCSEKSSGGRIMASLSQYYAPCKKYSRGCKGNNQWKNILYYWWFSRWLLNL